MKEVTIYTDGACSGNPGPGGYGAILIYKDQRKELSGGEPETTNNRMELTAAIESLSLLKESCNVTLYSDSKYLCDAVNNGWLDSWHNNGWRKSDKKPVLNIDLWKKIISLISFHKVDFIWVKGHNGHPENERCDFLATSYIKKFS